MSRLTKMYPDEHGSIHINNVLMEWTFKRSKGESVFGIRGSRIFKLLLKRDGVVSGKYDRGWEKMIEKDDDESQLCLEHILNTYGKEKKKEKK